MRILFITLLSFLYTCLAAQPGNNVSISKPFFLPLEKKIFYRLGDRDIPLIVTQYGDARDIVCINLHANEITSVRAARSVLEERGGTLIRIENKQQRLIRFRLKGMTYTFDPNRIFSRVGIEQTLSDNGRFSRDAMEEVEKFADRLLQLIPANTTCIVALHNNTEEAFSVKSYLPGNDRQQDAKAVYADNQQDVDDIAFTTDSLLYQKMADQRYNSILQDNQNARKDGSLSIYCGEKSRRYINIETQHGKLGQYIEMLERLLIILEGINKEMLQTGENPQ
ncbi:MAG: hypothetical protein ABIT05_00375 [Chitinophagaceae bacterium]